MSKEISKFKNSINAKLNAKPLPTLTAGVLAGIFIAIGGFLFASISSIETKSIWFHFFGSAAFSTGLILVVFYKAQLFTGNNLMLVNAINRSSSYKIILRNWLFVYFSNFIGSIILVTIVYFFLNKIGPLANHLNYIALKKTSYDFVEAFLKATFCNILVCTAIWLGITREKLFEKIMGIIIPITLFVFLGFEHSIANMFLIPLGLIYSEISTESILALLTKNLIPVTTGNIFGGLLVSFVIYFKGMKKSGFK